MAFQTETPFNLPPIYRAMVHETELAAVQAEITSALTNTTMEYMPRWGRTHKLSTKTFVEDYISEHDMPTVASVVNKHMQVYAEILGLSTIPTMRTSWMTEYNNGDYAHIHSHGWADISGCYYYKTCGADGTFFFDTPVKELEMAGYPQYVTRSRVTPAVGMLVLFPGWYPHGVTTNETQETRMSLAFNYRLKKTSQELSGE